MAYKAVLADAVREEGDLPDFSVRYVRVVELSFSYE
jgi:hypothetical protein